MSASSQVVACDLAEGAALLDLSSNIYYSLNEVGTEVWSGLESPCRVSELEAKVRSKFDVGNADVERDILEMLIDMNRAGLISISDGSPA